MEDFYDLAVLNKVNKLGEMFVNVKDFGAKGDGVSSDQSAFEIIKGLVGSTMTDIYIPKGDYRITSNLTIPSNIRLSFLSGARIVVNVGVTVTINGGIEAGLYQIFGGSGTIGGSSKVNSVCPQWFGATPDYNISTKVGTDNTLAFQKALNFAYSVGTSVVVPVGMYLLLGDITIPKGVEISGTNWNSNTVYRDSSDYKINGTCFVLRGMSFLVDTSTQVSKVTIYYDQQNYTIDTDLGQPDGLEPFVEYDPTFETIGAYTSGIRLEKILYLGGSTIFSSPSDNTEILRVNEIYGCCTKLAFKINQCADTSRFTNIHLNPNFLARPNWCGSYFDNFVLKLQYNLDVFSLKGIDESNFENITVYGCRNVVICENGAQSGFSMTNCSFDGIHRFLLLDNNTKSFGIKVSNTVFIPMIDKAVSGGTLINETAELIKATSNITGGSISFSNCNVHSDVINSDNIINLTSCFSVQVLLSNVFFITYDGKLFTSGSSTNEVLFRNCYRTGTTDSRIESDEWNTLSTVVFGANNTYQGSVSGNATDSINLDNVNTILFVAYRVNGSQKYRCQSREYPVKMNAGDDTIAIPYFENNVMIGMIDININTTAKTIRYRYSGYDTSSYNHSNIRVDIFYK